MNGTSGSCGCFIRGQFLITSLMCDLLKEGQSLPPEASCSSGSVKGQENDLGLPCSLQGWQRWTHQTHHIGIPEKSQWL